mgnify:CR=1 FL=1
MNATDAMGEGERTEGKPSPEDGAADGVRFVRNRADKDSRARFSLGRAFSCAWEGVVYTARTQRNMKIHFAVGAAAVLLGAALGIDAASWAAIVICIVLVLAAECLNTAVESVVDLVSPDYAELAKHAKDCAAGAVLVCALGAVAVAAAVFRALRRCSSNASETSEGFSWTTSIPQSAIRSSRGSSRWSGARTRASPR